MKATDLRIGNWVLIPTSMDGIIIPSFPKKVKGIGIFGGIDFTEPEYPENHIVPAVHCAGIPLTEEWLLKFGFKESKTFFGRNSFEKDGYHLIKNGKYFEFLVIGSSVILAKIKYVHQLQNLYFALTGKELEIK